MKVTVTPIVIGALGTIPKGLVKGLEDLEIIGHEEIIPSAAFLKSAKILSWVQDTLGDLLSLKLQWNTVGKRCFEKLSNFFFKNKK